MDRIDILLIHDVDVWTHGSEEARLQRFGEVMGGGYRAMLRLREEGVVRAIGAGINEIQACEDFARAGDFDCFLLAGRYTLLEQAALDTLLPYCAEQNISLLIGGPYNTGILATGAVEGAYYNYAPAPAGDHGAACARIEAVCARHRVRLASAALQFPLGHPNVATLIPGARSPEEIEQNRAIFEVDIPPAFWAELKAEGLLRADAPTPGLSCLPRSTPPRQVSRRARRKVPRIGWIRYSNAVRSPVMIIASAGMPGLRWTSGEVFCSSATST